MGSTIGVSDSAIPSTEQYNDGVSNCVPGDGTGLDLTVLGPVGTSTLPRTVLSLKKERHIRLNNKIKGESGGFLNGCFDGRG